MSRYTLCEQCHIASNINNNRPAQMANLWDDEDVRDIIRRYKKGETYEALAELYERTVYAIQCRLEHYRLIERVPNVLPIQWVPFGTVTYVYAQYVQSDPALKRERLLKEEEKEEKEECSKKKRKVKVKKGQ